MPKANSGDKNNFLKYIEEYKLLKMEIQQNSEDVFKIIQFGLSAAAALLAIAYSGLAQVYNEWRWIMVLLPVVVIFGLPWMIAQRIRQTRILGAYIKDELEEKLSLGWEKYQTRFNDTHNRVFILRFSVSSAVPLVFIEIVSLVLSRFELTVNGNINKYEIHWMIIAVILFLIILAQTYVLNLANHPDRYKKRLRHNG